MIGKELIGRESESVLLKIKQEDVRRFAEAAGIPYDDRVPVSYIGTLIKANIKGFELRAPNLILGEQKISYSRPLVVGESITYKRRIKDVYERIGKKGKMVFVLIETLGYDFCGEVIFSGTSTLIALEKGGDDENSKELSSI